MFIFNFKKSYFLQKKIIAFINFAKTKLFIKTYHFPFINTKECK